MPKYLNKKQAQILVDQLAAEWTVPPIRVAKVPKKGRAPGIGTYFIADPEWHIGITNRSTEDHVKHEFGHYLEAIIRIRLKTEEEIVDRLFSKA